MLDSNDTKPYAASVDDVAAHFGVSAHTSRRLAPTAP